MSLPLGIIRQALMKCDSLMEDLCLIACDEDMTEEASLAVSYYAELVGSIGAALLNLTNSEMDEAEFLSEIIDMDEIAPWPEHEEDSDLLNATI